MRGKTIALTILMLVSSLSGCVGHDHEDAHDFHGMEYNPASPAPDFTLTDQNGQSVSLTDFDNKVVVLAFTYTACPDVCLAIEANLNYIDEEMSDESDLVFLSITIDPARDTPAHLLEWTTARGYDWTHLTSDDHSHLAHVWDNYHLLVDTGHINSDHSDHENHSGMSHQVAVLYPDNTTSLLDGHHDMLPEENATGWNLTETTMGMNNVSLNYSVHETYGHSVTGINEVHSPSDWSWYWVLYIWDDTGMTWVESQVGIDEVMIMQDTDHVAWVASNANISLIPTPSEAMGGDESHGHDGVGGEEEMYEVGHNTVTFIIDKDGNKRLVYTGSDWSTVDFMEDLAHLLHHDSGAGTTSDDHSGHGH
tara:strand:+ start:104 stop:1198 length:1095 start_codon:yes stop_codon:yes gene_type:complete